MSDTARPRWVIDLMRLAESNPLIILKFDEDEWEALEESRRGITNFTIARPHHCFTGVAMPALCLLEGNNGESPCTCLGIISSKGPVTTLKSRIKIRRTVQIAPARLSDIPGLLVEQRHATNLRKTLGSPTTIVRLSPKLSSHIIRVSRS